MGSKNTYLLGDTCPMCQGNGKLPAKFDGYKIQTRLQDEGWKTGIESYPTKKDAKRQAKEWRDGPLGRSSMYRVIAPDGRIVWEG